jgi:glycosyltransferase involved in cell wall biosynthesis
MILISIVIATYNAEKTIERCLNSIIKQKTEQIELIIVDGLSNDNTVDIIRKYGDSVDVIISEPDKGLYDAWNKAIQVARGEWIEFIGADDCWLDGAAETYLQYIAGNDLSDVDIISAQAQLVDEDGGFLRIIGEPYKYEKFIRSMGISHGSTLHKKSLFDEVGLFSLDFRICADYELLMRKKLNARYIEAQTFRMQVGGMSWSKKGLKETYVIKRQKGYTSIIEDRFFVAKGMIILTCRNFVYRIKCIYRR